MYHRLSESQPAAARCMVGRWRGGWFWSGLSMVISWKFYGEFAEIWWNSTKSSYKLKSQNLIEFIPFNLMIFDDHVWHFRMNFWNSMVILRVEVESMMFSWYQKLTDQAASMSSQVEYYSKVTTYESGWSHWERELSWNTCILQ